MLVSVSTVKDTAPHLARFVDRNLHQGVDHMVVFLDAELPEPRERLATREHVTVVDAAGEEWWGAHRPPGLNRRQNVNANVVKALLSRLPWAEWLVHIDADEVVHLDRERLEALAPSTRVVHLAPLELVSRDEGAPQDLYKRLLGREELVLLTALGALEAPGNVSYFHGHVGGKSAIRPALDLFAGIHKPTDASGASVTGMAADWLRVLHLESPSRAEFGRKWRNLLSSGPRPKVRRARSDLVTALDTLINLDLPSSTVDELLAELYERHVRDDHDRLDQLGFLERIDPDERRYSPRRAPAEGIATFEAALARTAGQDKAVYRFGTPADVEPLLDDALALTGPARRHWSARPRPGRAAAR